MRMGRARRHRATSPVLAELLLMFISLIAGVMVGGFLFGIMASLVHPAEVTAVAAGMPPSLSSAPLSARCSSTGSSYYILLRNSGGGSTVAESLAISYGGETFSDALGGAACTVPAGGEVFLDLSSIGTESAISGQSFLAIIGLSNGASVMVPGTFG